MVTNILISNFDIKTKKYITNEKNVLSKVLVGISKTKKFEIKFLFGNLHTENMNISIKKNCFI